ncbi:MAG: YeeE/YedE thiosulfate transporter family protein [Nitrospirota bacterium]
MRSTENKSWSPYLAGGLTGLVIILSAWISKQYFGSSTCFVRVTGYIEKYFSSEHLASLEYFSRFVPVVDWQMMMVLGILIGSFISSVTSGSFRMQAVPNMWAERFGTNPVKRGIVAFFSGIVLMFGARLAGGCPSGYGLGALVQLAVSGLVVLICFFAGGIIVAQILYGGFKGK